MMRHIVSMLGAAALFAVPVALPATTSINMQPGLWQTTIEMTMANLPRLRAQHVYRRCITQADIDKNNILPQTVTRADLSCTPKDFKRSGNSATYILVCTGQAGKTMAMGKMTFSSTGAYTGTIHTTGQINGVSVDTNRTFHAERLGDCSSQPQKPAAPGTSGG